MLKLPLSYMLRYPRILIIFIVFLTLIVGLLLGWYGRKLSVDSSESIAQRKNSNQFQFINPLLECGETPLSSHALSPLESLIKTNISKLTNQTSINSISIYYRDLNNGPWIGINEKAEFAPASLFKVPILIAVLKYAESHPEILTTSLTYSNQFEADTNLLPNSTESLLMGQDYTVQSLLEKMIFYSDNLSKDLLVDYLNSKSPTNTNLINQVYLDLNLQKDILGASTKTDFVTVKDYAGLYRILYNASYLSQEMSETALSLLSQSTFKSAIVSGVPNDIKVAHKFGFREVPNEPLQLHDCGIVYLPSHPYLLCVMTKGNDFHKMESAISTLSRVIYQHLSSTIPFNTPAFFPAQP